MVAVSGVLIILILLVTLNPSFHQRVALDAFFSLTLTGYTIVFLSISTRLRRDIWQLAVVGLVLVVVQMLVLKVHFKPFPALALLGMTGFLLVAIRRVWSYGGGSRLLQDALVPPLLLVLMSYWGSTLLGITGTLHPKTLDLFLYDFDQSLGVQLSCKVGQIVLHSPWLRSIAVSLYRGLPLAVMFVYARQLLRERSFASTAFLALFMAGPVGVVFYNLVPACGPIYLLGARFPFDPPSLLELTQLPLHSEAVSGARNAFPSLHMGWALLVWWYSYGLSLRARFLLFLFLMGTAFSILGLGEHYFVDLVAASPFAVMIEAGCALQLPVLDRRRVLPFSAGLILMLSWVGLLRSGLGPAWASPVSSWTLIALTISVSLFLHARLRVAVREASGAGTR